MHIFFAVLLDNGDFLCQPFCVRDWPDEFSVQEALDFFFHLCCDLRRHLSMLGGCL